MTTVRTSPAGSWEQTWPVRGRRTGAYGAAPDCWRSAREIHPAPRRASGIVARPKVAPDRLAERLGV